MNIQPRKDNPKMDFQNMIANCNNDKYSSRHKTQKGTSTKTEIETQLSLDYKLKTNN